ncbi:SH3 domain-containing protein [Amaricoccus tamworthensis]|uniref:SH3 domain-containing protein n=1 Tax=Amaricoccus tamworthensis TaxID=57002 RepID=UPI003C7DD5DA
MTFRVTRAVPAFLVLVACAIGTPLRAPAQEAPTIGPDSLLPLPRYVSIRGDRARARRGPSRDQKIDWEYVRQGLPLRITAEYDNWRRVEDFEGQGGWMHKSLLSNVRTGLVQGDGLVTVLDDPEDGAEILANAEPGAVLRLRECGPDWCEVSAQGVEGWLRREALWGIDPGEVID